ncbi:MAG TPA: amylo-alpha-1,6-glucosidase [Chthonomonadaceae bacterium]|nr:amylo-alpha-1,6-glucosidase [Chthonomonadaceae bacterium]
MSQPVPANITLDAATLRDDAAALRREWLVTNGLGGYASASVAGANTRRYHGLLVAALRAPVGRAVLLSKLEETLEVTLPDAQSPQSFPLSTNLYPGVLHPQGHYQLESWTAYPAPTWVWSPAPSVRLEKRVWMARGHNTTYIAYRLLEAPPGSTARLSLVPLLAWKDYHSEMHAGDVRVDAAWTSPAEGASETGLLRVTLPGVWGITEGAFSLNLWVAKADGAAYPGAAFTAQATWYYRFQHPREEERGLDHEEDLYTPGTLTAPLAVGESLVVVASAEEGRAPAPQASLQALEARQTELLQKARAQNEFMQLLTLAADAFVVEVPGVRTSVIAGYHWFADWGRDTMIALPGLCLVTGRPELAREILISFAAYVDQGMLPNRFPDKGETPEYNTADATLWYFNAIYHYILATGDVTLLKDALWSVLEGIVGYHRQGTRYNIHVDADHLLYAGQSGVQLTWMDAKVGDWVVTPRIGKPVEINALWHNALRIMSHFAGLLDDGDAAARYAAEAKQSADSFLARFPRPDGKGLYDVLDTPDGGAPDPAVRPNQVFALSLPFAPLEPEGPVAESIIAVLHDKLWTYFGMRTLAPDDPNYRPRYGGDQWSRDGAYHQGTAWPWLLGPFAEAYYKVHGNKAIALAMFEPLREHLSEFGLGSIAEIFDGEAPQHPNGCIAQAWSVAETLRVWNDLLKG